MPKPDLKDFKPYILKRLKNSGRIDDIILHVCERTGASWQSVSDYINMLSEEHKDDIVLGQSPLLIALAFMTLLLGSGMIATTLYEMYGAFMEGKQELIYFIQEDLSHIITMLVVGSAMIIGSVKGMQSVWESILVKAGIL
jgi:hypothetical protein